MSSSQSTQYAVGVIGYGMSAKIFHIPFILAHPSFTLHSIVQRNPTPTNNASSDHPTAQIHNSIDSLLTDPSIHLIVITTPPPTHYSLAHAALTAHKHVLLEKPFTPTSTEAYQLAEVATQNNVLLTIYQNRRYDADFLTLRSLLTNNTLGRIAEFESHFDRHRPDPPTTQTWKTDPDSYSAVFDLGTHLIDQVVSIYGLPDRVTGFAGSQRQSVTSTSTSASSTRLPIDSFTAHLHYPAPHPLATLKASIVSPTPTQLRFWVRGTTASFLKYHLDPQEDQLKSGLGPTDAEYGIESKSRHGQLSSVTDDGGYVQTTVEPVRGGGGYIEFYDQLATALQSGKEEDLPVRARVAADVIRLCELVERSSAEGRTLEV